MSKTKTHAQFSSTCKKPDADMSGQETKAYVCNHCNTILPSRNKLFDHIYGRNGAESCMAAIKKGVKQDIKMRRVLMHIGYHGDVDHNKTLSLNHDASHDRPLYSFDAGKDSYSFDGSGTSGGDLRDIAKINTDHVMKLFLRAFKRAILEMSTLLKLSEKDAETIFTKVVQSMSRATAISSRRSYHYRHDERTSASCDVISCVVPSFALATSNVNQEENFVNRLNRHVKASAKALYKQNDAKGLFKVFSFIPLKSAIHAVHDRK